MPVWGIPLCLAAAVLIGFCSSIIPASIAARTEITEALRHSG
jgi:ABC-type lipoprotein release transport system permease subunit